MCELPLLHHRFHLLGAGHSNVKRDDKYAKEIYKRDLYTFIYSTLSCVILFHLLGARYCNAKRNLSEAWCPHFGVQECFEMMPLGNQIVEGKTHPYM